MLREYVLLGGAHPGPILEMMLLADFASQSLVCKCIEAAMSPVGSIVRARLFLGCKGMYETGTRRKLRPRFTLFKGARNCSWASVQWHCLQARLRVLKYHISGMGLENLFTVGMLLSRLKCRALAHVGQTQAVSMSEDEAYFPPLNSQEEDVL